MEKEKSGLYYRNFEIEAIERSEQMDDVVRNTIQKFKNNISMIDKARYEEYMLLQTDHNRNHNSAGIEHRLLDYIRNGDEQAIIDYMESKSSFDEYMDTKDSIGLIAESSKKQMEYSAVIMVTLTSREAAASGVSIEEAYTLSDIFLQRIAEAVNPEEYVGIIVEAELTYAHMVKEYRGRRRYAYIESCKEYIGKNLRKPIKISDIGPAIGINNSYLSKRFAAEEGLTIRQYLIKERCIHAANLLKYSDYDLSTIAEYFCFSSQSHFGNQFKKVMGMTPKEYRTRYKNTTVYISEEDKK